MSSDARLHGDGWGWWGNHDGPCTAEVTPADHAQPAPLSLKVVELERCLGLPLRWELDRDWPGGDIRLRGWGW